MTVVLEKLESIAVIRKQTAKLDSSQFSVAPMMEITDRFCRSFHRVLSRRATLYTEMITASAIVHGVREGLLGFDVDENPVLQIGGCDAQLMAESAAIGEQYGYREININCGCPSDRVKRMILLSPSSGLSGLYEKLVVKHLSCTPERHGSTA